MILRNESSCTLSLRFSCLSHIQSGYFERGINPLALQVCSQQKLLKKERRNISYVFDIWGSWRGKMGIGIGRFCPGKIEFKPLWDWNLVTWNGKKTLKIKNGNGIWELQSGIRKKYELGNRIGTPQNPHICNWNAKWERQTVLFTSNMSTTGFASIKSENCRNI